MPNSISDQIKARAAAEGFDLVRFASAQAAPQNAARLGEFLEAGHHGEMDWMAQRATWRADPQAVSVSDRIVADCQDAATDKGLKSFEWEKYVTQCIKYSSTIIIILGISGSVVNY